MVHSTFTKDFEVEHEQRNALAVDINESNVTISLFRSCILAEIYRIEISLSKVVIAYAERRKGIVQQKLGRL